MKVACLISGQLRPVDPNLLNNGLKTLTKHFQSVDYYVDVWNQFGISMAHDPARLDIQPPPEEQVKPYLGSLLKNLPCKSIQIHNYQIWRTRLSNPLREIQSRLDKTDHRNMLAQLYMIEQSFRNIDTAHDYDFAIRMRPDNLFTLPLFESVESNEIRHINFGPIAFHPNRIYDIFFAVGRDAIVAFHTLIEETKENTDQDIDNGLSPYDACRILFAHATRHRLTVTTFNTRYTDVYRGGSVGNYISELNRLQVLNNTHQV